MFNFSKYCFIFLSFFIICFSGLTFCLSSTGDFSFAENIIQDSNLTLIDSSFVWPTPRL